jgi:hypothetical protein
MDIIVKEGSILQTAQEKGITIEEAILDAEVVILVDDSGTMADDDAYDLYGHECARITAAQQQLDKLMEKYRGKVVVVAFSNEPVLRAGGDVEQNARYGGTNMTSALELALGSNLIGIPTIVISDGLPNSPFMALAVAKKYTGAPLHTVYIGPEGSTGSHFMNDLRNAAKFPGDGLTVEVLHATELLEATERMLLTG